MAIKVGTSDLSSLKIGDSEIKKVMLSGQKIWPIEEPKPYLTFISSVASFTLAVANAAKNWDGILEYSNDAQNWTEWDGSTVLSSSYSGMLHKLYMRGMGNSRLNGLAGSNPGGDNGNWILTGNRIRCSGNIETLLDYATVQNDGHPAMARNCFYILFTRCTSLVSCPSFPATVLSEGCYRQMFFRCTSLETLPKLPATDLADSCYAYMFAGCTLIKLSTNQTPEYSIPYRIPISGSGSSGNNSLQVMFTGTGGTFTGTPAVNTTYYTSNALI